MELVFISYELQRIKNLFREFYGELPIMELAKNELLAKKIEVLETQIRRLLDGELSVC